MEVSPEVAVPNRLYGFCGRKATFKQAHGPVGIAAIVNTAPDAFGKQQ